MTKNDEKWLTNYEALKAYIDEHHHLPDKHKVENRGLLNLSKYTRIKALLRAEAGQVTLTGAMNKAEKAVARAVREAGYPLVVMTAGSNCPGMVVEQGRYHSLEATNEMGVIMEAKAHKYHPFKTEDILNK